MVYLRFIIITTIRTITLAIIIVITLIVVKELFGMSLATKKYFFLGL